MSDLANLNYVDRVNRAIDYVTSNLSASLKLEEVARVAHFSPYHFHRVFRSLVGETLHDFATRLRLERAVALLSYGGERTLTEIALESGFGSSSSFSRTFRKRFGVAPRAFDVEEFRRTRRGEMIGALPGGERLARLPDGTNPDGFTVRLRKLPARRVAYVRVFRPYEADRVHRAALQMLAWARGRGLAGGQWLGYQWDDPEIVPLAQCRYDIGLEVSGIVTLDGGVSETRFPTMTVAEIDIAGTVELELRAIDWLYRTWLPRSGYVPDHQPGFEAFIDEPFAHGTEYFTLKAQIPVVPIGT